MRYCLSQIGYKYLYKNKHFNMDNLQKQITKLNEQLISQIPKKTLQAFQKSIQELKDNEIEKRSLNLGDTFPNFKLKNSNHKTIELKELLNEQKIIIAFLRGSWCPYCNLEINAFQNEINKFKNVKLIIITPQTENDNSNWHTQNNLSFDILSDKENKLAKKVGIDFNLQEFVIPYYEKIGIDLPKINQAENHTLPIPAVYLLNEKGCIIYKFVNANYMERININQLIKQL